MEKEQTGKVAVTPENLLAGAEQWRSALKQAESALLGIEEELEGMEYCFMGRTAKCLLGKMNREIRVSGEWLRQLFKYPEKLEEIAAKYQAAERKNTNAV